MLSLATMLLIFILALASLTAGHPGHNIKLEAATRSEYLKTRPQSLSGCTSALRSRGYEEENLKRRQHMAERLRRKKGLYALHSYLKARDLSAPFAVSRQSKNINLAPTDSRDVFADHSSCILQPESIEGPYYVDGESIRNRITNGERGIPMHLDIQIVDTSTCEPLPAIYLDFWQCNATGVYSGVVADGNGDPSDSDNLQNTAFRGLQKTDEAGVVQFETIFPGHYLGRANHAHVLTHFENATTLHENNTLSGLTASHVGQIYFDQDLINLVETSEPYTENSQSLTPNDGDAFLGAEIRRYDPIVEHVLLGQDITDGILAWISIGIDPTKTNTVVAGETFSGGSEGDGGRMADIRWSDSTG